MMEWPRTTMSSLVANFVNCSLGYAPGGGTPDTTIPHWVTFWLCFCIKLYCWSQVSASSLSLIGVFAVTDAGTSGSLINSVATSVFPSDCCNKDNNPKRPKNLLAKTYYHSSWRSVVVTIDINRETPEQSRTECNLLERMSKGIN